jgi:spore maturation protein CgeB
LGQQKHGFKIDGDFQLPVNLNVYKPLQAEKEWDIGFIGRSTDKRERNFDMFTPRREAYLGVLKRDFEFLHVSHGLTGKNLVEFLNKIKVHLNLHIDTYRQLQHRMQNILACNQFVISDPLTHNEDLQEYKHFVPFFNASDLFEKTQYYLDNESERLAIAEQGFEFVKKRFDAEICWKNLLCEVM